MKFARYLHNELIFFGLPCNSKEESVRYLTEAVCNYYKLPYKDEILYDVMKREKIKSTGLGNGLAILHGRVELLDRLYVAFARADKGIEWQAVDNNPVHYIFFIVGPTKLEREYLEALGDISRIMLRHDVREGIHTAKKAEEAIAIIKESGVRHGKRSKE